MQTTKWLLLCMLVVGGLTRFAVTEVSAVEPLPLSAAAPQPPPRTCDATMIVLGKTLGTVRIEAGPGGDFPVTEPCPAGFSGLCKKWEYRWTALTPGLNLNLMLASVDSDVQINNASPAATIVKSLPGFIVVDTDGERFVKFTAAGTPTTFTGAFWTPATVGTGTLTAAFVGKKGSLPVFARCAIAGADNLVPEAKEAVDKLVVDQAGPCRIERTIDAQKRTAALTTVSNDPNFTCTDVGLKTLGVEGHGGALFINGEAQISVHGSTLTCFTSTFTGKMTCVKQTP